MMEKAFLTIAFAMMAVSLNAQQKVISLYDGPAPGSENWNWEEKTFFVKDSTTIVYRGNKISIPPLNGNIVYNVTKPTLTAFSPVSPNGTAVIICTGGGLRIINSENEGSLVAAELNKKGITVFLLKHRLIRSVTNNPWKETLTSLGDTAKFRVDNGAAVRQMVNDDAIAAITWIRKHAAEFKIDPKRVGVIGFSGGGGLALHLALTETPELRASFVGLIYCTYGGRAIPPNAPPAFIASASDDALAPSSHSTNLYQAWMASKNSAELHIYSKGGHGLRGSETSRTWTNRFAEWLNTQGVINP